MFKLSPYLELLLYLFDSLVSVEILTCLPIEWVEIGLTYYKLVCILQTMRNF